MLLINIDTIKKIIRIDRILHLFNEKKIILKKVVFVPNNEYAKINTELNTWLKHNEMQIGEKLERHFAFNYGWYRFEIVYEGFNIYAITEREKDD